MIILSLFAGTKCCNYVYMSVVTMCYLTIKLESGTLFILKDTKIELFPQKDILPSRNESKLVYYLKKMFNKETNDIKNIHQGRA